MVLGDTMMRLTVNSLSETIETRRYRETHANPEECHPVFSRKIILQELSRKQDISRQKLKGIDVSGLALQGTVEGVLHAEMK